MSVRLSLAVAAPRTEPLVLARFFEALSYAALEACDEVCLAASRGPESAASALQQACDGRDHVSLSIHAEDTSLMRLWGFAMARTRGSHVAVLDARDPPAPRWAQAWAESPRDRIVCGPVNPGTLIGSVSWAAYLSEYGQFLEPLDPTRLWEVPGNNLVLPRELLPSVRDLETSGFWKTFHLERIRRRQSELPITVAPLMRVEQQRHYELAIYLRRRALHGRCYAGKRLLEPGAPPRLLSLGFTPLLPFLRTWRVVRRMRGRRTTELRRAFPALFLGEIAWSLGELLGYASGPGDACERLW